MKCKIRNTNAAKSKIANLGFSQSGFSSHILVSTPFLSQVLNKKRSCSPETAKKIANGINEKISDIFLIDLSDDQTKKKAK